MSKPETEAEIEAYEELNKPYEKKTIEQLKSEREGVVVRPKIEMRHAGGRLSFKAISNKYLLNNEE